MAVTGTLLAAAPSSVGFWAECTLASAVSVTGTSTASTSIIAFVTNTNPGGTATASLYQLNPNLPIACTVLAPATLTAASGSTYTSIQGGSNNIHSQESQPSTGGIGLQQVQYSVTNNAGTLTLTFVNAGASSTLSAGTRLLFVQNQGN